MSDIYKEIYNLKKQIEEYKEDFRKIRSIIICIGGPLNDNVLGYSKEQLVPFSQIYNIAKYHTE